MKGMRASMAEPFSVHCKEDSIFVVIIILSIGADRSPE